MPLLQEFESLWSSAGHEQLPNVVTFLSDHSVTDGDVVLAVLQLDQKYRWKTVKPLTVEEYLERLPTLPAGVDWRFQLAVGEFEARRDTERPLSEAEISSRFPDLSETLRQRLKESQRDATSPPEVALEVKIDPLCDEFEAAWRDSDQRADLMSFLQRMPPDIHEQLLEELLHIELWWRNKRGERPVWDDYASRFPQHTELIRRLLDQPVASLSNRRSRSSRRDPDGSATVTYITSQAIGVDQKGRYRLDRVLGEGGFGRVYLGYDEELQRQVAIKVPTRERFQKLEDAETYLAEARTVASLDHPNIVPVYDMGRTDDGSVYVVSRFIDGDTLQDRIKDGDLSERCVGELLATVATALHFAHQRRLIHRDVKPANILIESSTSTPFVADFGLAVREEDYLQQTALAGTPAYMSPEQARGEGHRLDGRSDVFALGVILYEALTGRKPFCGSSPLEIVNQVIASEAPSPRILNDTMSPELERICLKALSKRASDRYATAAAMAEDLRAFARPQSAVRPWHLAAGVLICIAVVVGLFIAAPRLLLTQTVPPGANEVDESTQIESVRFEQLLLNDNGDHESVGFVVKNGYRLRLGDGVQFQAQLSRPAYCYWIGFRPDGVEELCFPADPQIPPPLTDSPAYPLERVDNVIYGLVDGVGIQAFALVVSDGPLPPYSEWREKRSPSPWAATKLERIPRVRRHDGREENTFRIRQTDPRGAGLETIVVKNRVEKLADWLQDDEAVDALEVWALPVMPR